MGSSHSKRERRPYTSQAAIDDRIRQFEQYQALAPAVRQPYLERPGQTQLAPFPQTVRSPEMRRDRDLQRQDSHHHGGHGHGGQYETRDSGLQRQDSHPHQDYYHGAQYERRDSGLQHRHHQDSHYQGSDYHRGHPHGGHQYEGQLPSYRIQHLGPRQQYPGGGHHPGPSHGPGSNPRQQRNNQPYSDPRDHAADHGRSGLGRGAGAGSLHVMDSEAPGNRRRKPQPLLANPNHEGFRRRGRGG